MLPAENTTITPLPQMPFHFIPQSTSYLFSQIHFGIKEFAQIDMDNAINTALDKLKKQSNDDLPVSDDRTKAAVAGFLKPQTATPRDDAFKALKSEYSKLKEPIGNRSITGYVKSVEATFKNIDHKYSEFLKKEKKAFFDAYKEGYPDAENEKIKGLWVKYEKNLQVNLQTPLTDFKKHIDKLVPNAFIHYVNRLGKNSEITDAELLDGKINEKLDRKLNYTDSNEKPIVIINDKKTGKPSEIIIKPMSSLFGSSGNMGDAYAVLAAHHGKDVPIKIVVPIFEDDHIYTEMKDFFAIVIFLIFTQLYKYLEKKHYIEQAKQASLDKGISLDNISLFDTRNRPISFSEKDKLEINKKIQELEKNSLTSIRDAVTQQEERHQSSPDLTA